MFGRFGIATLLCILPGREPLAVIGAVAPIVIDSIYRQIICIAVFLCPFLKNDEIRPFRAYPDSASAVPMEPLIGLVVASGAHILPNAVKARPA